MEALEELQELNKREVKVNYDDMLSSYDKIREVVKFEVFIKKYYNSVHLNPFSF
jgi:hypothetical protein